MTRPRPSLYSALARQIRTFALAHPRITWAALARQKLVSPEFVGHILNNSYERRFSRCVDCDTEITWRSHMDHPRAYVRCANCALSLHEQKRNLSHGTRD